MSTKRIKLEAVVLLPLILAGLLVFALLAGCGDRAGDDKGTPTVGRSAVEGGSATTAAGVTGAGETPGVERQNLGEGAASRSPSQASGGQDLGNLLAAQAALDRKVISNATVQIEVEKGKFQLAYDQALLLADRYGGYIVSSSTSTAGEERVVRSGTIALRVPSQSLPRLLNDAAKLGIVKSRRVESQDVTQEFVDLKARLTNAQAQEKALLALMDRAKTIDDILQVRQVLSSTQQEVEQIKGRLGFLEEHTSYATVTLSLYEAGVEVASTGGWGFLGALRDALHEFVDSVNKIIVGLGSVLPALILLALLIWVGYLVIRPMARRLRGTGGRSSLQPAAANDTGAGYPGPQADVRSPVRPGPHGQNRPSQPGGPTDGSAVEIGPRAIEPEAPSHEGEGPGQGLAGPGA